MTTPDSIAALALSHHVPEAVSHSGKHHIILPVEGSLFRADTAPGIDYALRFDGSTSVVTVDDIPSVGVVGRYTFACWLRPSGHQNASILAANVGRFSDDNSHSFALQLMADRGASFTYAHYSVGTRIPIFLGSVPRDQWFHLAFVYDRDADRAELFVNGRTQGAKVAPAGDIELLDMRIGQDEGHKGLGAPGVSNHFRGDVDEVTFWDEAVSAEHILSIASDQAASDLTPPIFRFTLDDGPAERDPQTGTSTPPGANQRVASRGRLPDVHGEIDGASWVFSSRPFGVRTPLDQDSIRLALDDAINQQTYDPRLFSNPSFLSTPESRDRAAQLLGSVDVATATAAVSRGKRLRFYRATTGSLAFEFEGPVGELRPELALTESYMLSTFRGAYGPGRIVNTFSLLPGEETEISISSYSEQTDSSERGDSILDSSSETVAEEFADEIEAENSLATSSSERFEASGSVTASASTPVWSAEAQASTSGGSESAREALANTVSNIASKRAAEASSKRNIEVTTAVSTGSTTGTRNETVRTIRNINVGRTLNFVFRQMNQEYISLLHLVNIEVSFRIAGLKDSFRTVPLAQLDDLLEDVIVDATGRDQVRMLVLSEIQSVHDYEGVAHPKFVKAVPAREGDQTYSRVDRRYTSQYLNPTTETDISVRGIIVDATSIVMRTDHVYVDTFIGQGDALDSYSKGLQNEALEREMLENDQLRERLRTSYETRQRYRQAAQLIRDGDKAGLEMLTTLNGASGSGDGEELL